MIETFKPMENDSRIYKTVAVWGFVSKFGVSSLQTGEKDGGRKTTLKRQQK